MLRRLVIGFLGTRGMPLTWSTVKRRNHWEFSVIPDDDLGGGSDQWNGRVQKSVRFSRHLS
jgi:hypothetical protein